MKMTEQKKYIEKFRESFALEFGYYPTVTTRKRRLVTQEHTLETLGDLINDYTDGELIDSVSRKRKLVVLRSIFCMLAADMGYTFKQIGNYIKRDHSTATYNVNLGYDLLETNKEFQEFYIKVSTKVNPRIYPHARINETPFEESSDSKSAGTIRMSARKYQITRPDPRITKRSDVLKSRTVFN